MSFGKHEYIEGKVERNIIKSKLESKLDARTLFTTDRTLQGEIGDLIKTNKYVFDGAVVDADTGLAVADADRGKVSFTTEEHRIKVYKSVYDITDKERRQNAIVEDVCMEGTADVVFEKIQVDFFAELAKISKTHEYTVFNWDTVEDAIATLNLEDRTGMFLLINPKMFSTLKKSSEVKGAQNGEIIFSGQMKTVDGLPIVVNKRVPDDTAYIASKDTVTNLIKTDPNVSKDVYNELEKETTITKFGGLVYISDERKAVKLTKKTV